MADRMGKGPATPDRPPHTQNPAATQKFASTIAAGNDIDAILALSGERDLYLRRILAGERAAYARGYARAHSELAAAWHAVADPVSRSRPSYAELERRRWMLRGEPRTRATFGQPHHADYEGAAA